MPGASDLVLCFCVGVKENRTDDDRLMTIQELATYLHVPVRTLYNWRWRGEGPPALKLGGHHVRFRPSEVDAWLEHMRERRS